MPMNHAIFQMVCFVVFAVVAVGAALAVVSVKNTVHGVLALVLTFFSAACLWILAEAEFLGLALVVVYVGAVMVLFLFVVMMINLNMDGLREGFWKHFPLAAVVGVVIALEMAYVLMGGFRDSAVPRAFATGAVTVSNTQALGFLLYTEYLYPLEIAAVILLVAIVSAIALTLRRRKDSKAIDPADQVRVRAADRLSIVSLTATRAAADTGNLVEQKL